MYSASYGYANMDQKGKIAEYRGKLDKTLASSDLTDDESVHTLVSNQLGSQLGENGEFLSKTKSKEVANFLGELRSVSKSDDSGWKLKQDTDELRVMYREGPEGTPFHTLLCEGFVDGPVDVCVCISCESNLYKIWWPQVTIPTFRIVSSHLVKKVRMGEQISLVRMKLSWPLSSREALIHYFVFEYFKDGLIVVLLKSVSDSENIEISTHGFSRDGIPEAEDVVRIDVFGGFAIQKVSDDRSYFRTIANMDIKLDFAPPSLINFIARQLVGSGFKLYKKEVSLNSKADGKFRDALKDPLYTRIHEALYGSTSMLEKQNNDVAAFEEATANEITLCDDSDANDVVNEIEGRDSDRFKSSHEITEEEVRIDKTDVGAKQDDETKVTISRDVRQALETLEKAINMLREYNSKKTSSENDEAKTESGVESLKSDSARLTSHAPRISSSRQRGSFTKERKIVPDEGLSSPPDVIKLIDSQSSVVQKNASAIPEILSSTVDAKRNASKTTKRKNMKGRFCCLNFSARS